MSKRAIAITLAFAMLAMMLAACASGDATVSESDVTSASDTVTEAVTELQPDLPDVDLEGDDVNFLVEENGGYDWYTSKEIYAETQTGELFNDAVYTRNLKIEERFNVVITQARLQGCTGVARKSLTANDTEYDVTMPYMNDAISLPQEGFFLNLYDVNYLELSNPWWDQRANENLVMGGKLFFTTGDISILDNECTMVMFFNKNMITDYNLESPYTLVNDNKWTIDKVFDMSADVTEDIDGDGKYTHEDRWGISMASNAPHSMFFSAGERIAKNNAEGILELVMMSPRSTEVVEKVLGRTFEDSVLSDKTAGSGFDDVSIMFNAGRIMFVTFALVDINALRDAEFEFGILPYPLYNEQQDEYNNLISTGIVPALSIPYNCTKLDTVGIVLEAMAYYSVDTLTVAYYDNALKTRYIRDDESGEMLDIIFETRVYDLGFIFNWGGIGGLIQSMYSKKSTEFASEYAKIEEKTLTAMSKTLDAFANIGK